MTARSEHNSRVLDFGGRKVPVDLILAAKLGLDKALFLQQLYYLIGIMADDAAHEFEDRIWVSNTYGQWQEMFPFWSKRKIEEMIKQLQDEGIVLARQRKSAIRTKLYSINTERLYETVGNSVHATNQVSCNEHDMRVEESEHRVLQGPIPADCNKQNTGASIHRDIKRAKGFSQENDLLRVVLCNG